MATHNQVRAVGFLLKDPVVMNAGVPGGEKIFFTIRTMHRDVDHYYGPWYQDLTVYYDGEKDMEKMKRLVQYDVVDIKGVFNILTINKKSSCPDCHATNVKERGSSCFIYPISLIKLNSLWAAYGRDPKLPEEILRKYYKEVSNQVLIIGTIVNTPELIGTEKRPCCRYRLGVDRKYYVATQGDITADYPWVYSYGDQATWDYRHLKEGSVILVDGFMQTRRVKPVIQCASCGVEYKYDDVVVEFVPYSIEYLQDYYTDLELSKIEETQANKEQKQAEAAIFGD